jgi:hypothetical protein
MGAPTGSHRKKPGENMTRRRARALLIAASLYAVGATTLWAQAQHGPMATGRGEAPAANARAHRVPPLAPSGHLAEGGMAGFNSGGVRLAPGSPSRTAQCAAQSLTTPAPNVGVVASPIPEATDPTGLTVTKAWDGTNWQVTLSWSGGFGPYTVSYCNDPTFQSGVVTMAKTPSGSSMTLQGGSQNLECYVVTDASTVSPAVQGMGYDPQPPPTVPTTSGTGLWWGDSVTFTGNYLDPIPAGNIAEMYDLPVRATSATGTPPYATAATFVIPDDARSFNAFVQAHGRSCSSSGLSLVSLYPPGIGPYTQIRGIAYVPQSGHVWIAANSVAQEVDIFQRTPVVVPGRTWTDLAKPCISQVTTGNKILLVDSGPGVGTIYQVDLSTGLRTAYASTTDGGFTRDIWPVGIAADPDGSACYIADSNWGLVVKIPSGNGSAIVDNWGNWTWNFPDPCGMDANVGHQVAVASADGWNGYIPNQTDTWLLGYTTGIAYSLLVDRDVSSSSYFYANYSNDNGMAEAFNLNAIGSNPAAYHEGTIFGKADGHVVLDPTSNYAIYHHWPQRVVINNSGQNQVYPSVYQSQDRIVQMLIEGWASRKVRLRVIDPPDLSPYAPYGGYPARHDSAVPPYEANDNFGTTDYGIATLPDGSDAAPSKVLQFPAQAPGGPIVTPITFYLKIPARYSGDNFQVEATKCNYSGTVLPQRVMGLSAVYTSWKRVFVERDHMFRRGGLLLNSYGAAGACGSPMPNCCGTGLELPCNQLLVYSWSNVVSGDSIVVFDELTTAEAGGETRTVQAVADNGDGSKTITLDTPLTKSYHASNHTGLPPMPTFSASAPDTPHSGGIGVVSDCDSAPNQINFLGSCYFDTDLRDIEQPFDDGYVELLAPRSGMGALPYIDSSVFSFSTLDLANALAHLAKIWFSHCGGGADWRCGPNNYLHALGVSQSASGGYLGLTLPALHETFVFVNTIQTDPQRTYFSQQSTTEHELAHQFVLNPCASDCGGHDSNLAWCDSTNHCERVGGTDPIRCLMNEYSSVSDDEDGINRFDTTDLLDGISSSCTVPCTFPNADPITYTPPAGSIRQNADPQ